MNFLVDIDNRLYVRTEEVFMILKNEKSLKSIKYIVESAKTSKRFVPVFGNKTTETLILLEDGTVFSSHLQPATVADRMQKSGKFILMVSPGIYLSVVHIKAIFDYSKAKVVELMTKTDLAVNELQFIGRSEEKSSVVLTNNKYLVELSEDSVALTKKVETNFE